MLERAVSLLSRFDTAFLQWSSGLSTTIHSTTFKDKTISVAAFPLGIDPDIFYKTISTEPVQRRIAELEEEFEDIRIMVGVDRLDYVKGVPHKLRSFEVFLEDHPECVGSVVFIQVAVPTRGDVEEHQNLRTLVNELVGRINGRFGKSPNDCHIGVVKQY